MIDTQMYRIRFGLFERRLSDISIRNNHYRKRRTVFLTMRGKIKLLTATLALVPLLCISYVLQTKSWLPVRGEGWG